MRLLLAAGADPSARGGRHDETPLHGVVAERKVGRAFTAAAAEVATALLDAGAEVDLHTQCPFSDNDETTTPLFSAVSI